MVIVKSTPDCSMVMNTCSQHTKTAVNHICRLCPCRALTGHNVMQQCSLQWCAYSPWSIFVLIRSVAFPALRHLTL